jgi:hypothetical protein
MEHRKFDPADLPADDDDEIPPGHDVQALGPSDSSDTGADMTGLGRHDTSDRQATGERMSVEQDPALRDAHDIEPDRVVTSGEVGLGGGLDQAEEARFGVTDEELAELRRRKRSAP